MGALPNRLLETDKPRRKPIRKAAKEVPGKCKTRTLPQIEAEARSRTNYVAGTGYMVCFHAAKTDLYRLSSGQVCDRLILNIFQDLSLRGRGPTALPDESSALSVTELAAEIRCDERSVNRALEYLEARKMATVARLADSRFVITLHYRAWAKIEPSYQEWDEARRLAEAEVAGEELEAAAEAETATVKPGIVPITSKPRVVRAGHRERSLPITSGTKTFRFDWTTPGLDLRYSAVIDSGEVVVTASIAEKQPQRSNASAKRTESVDYGKSSGHGRPNGTKIPPNGGNRKTTKTTTVELDHPRAAELAALFDPLLYQWCKKTLSGDPSVHQKACEAIGDTPHDDLVKAAVDRAARTLTPLHVPSVCREIEHNWQKSKNFPGKDPRRTVYKKDTEYRRG